MNFWPSSMVSTRMEALVDLSLQRVQRWGATAWQQKWQECFHPVGTCPAERTVCSMYICQVWRLCSVMWHFIYVLFGLHCAALASAHSTQPADMLVDATLSNSILYHCASSMKVNWVVLLQWLPHSNLPLSSLSSIGCTQASQLEYNIVEWFCRTFATLY